MPNYRVKQGDCLSKIAFQHGFDWKILWGHPRNAALKAKRKNPNILHPGDVLFIPDKETRWETCATTRRHTFVKKRIPEELNIVVKIEGRPMAGEKFALEIDGEHFSGSTDRDGRVRVEIPPDARSGRLSVGQGFDRREFELRLGHMDPEDEVSGIQGRLDNLGYRCGKIDGKVSSSLVSAIKAFQKSVGIQASGEMDEDTKNALVREHGK